ncbi:Uncharacterised protein [Vibrio cholerae]|uniref:Uncharacterized protein n=1 Tax=Vibrio cholerae TaxID=666 RepID=A0A655RG67_VIBCL|nr:Uncharacterised protein [Vibrio cholerae]CSB43468.1 Uncharacterised protein [Vibrio cholerae]CSB77678.1 Uncharacterised protein [Vibrio cholerae]CSB93806.1 Uncharacterised protein [Vibrio cholerae]CSC01648.1 Uncharacterised protein [Vibrio cholerae]
MENLRLFYRATLHPLHQLLLTKRGQTPLFMASQLCRFAFAQCAGQGIRVRFTERIMIKLATPVQQRLQFIWPHGRVIQNGLHGFQLFDRKIGLMCQRLDNTDQGLSPKRHLHTTAQHWK